MISFSADDDLRTTTDIVIVGTVGDIEPSLVKRIRNVAVELYTVLERAGVRIVTGIHFRVDAEMFSAVVPILMVKDSSMNRLGPLVDIGDDTILVSRVPFDEPEFLKLDAEITQVADSVAGGKLGPMYFLVETHIDGQQSIN
jgi:hypothetical protein